MLQVTRRNFLRGAGASLAGLAFAGSAGLLLNNTALAIPAAPGVLPYAKLDPDKAMARAYEGYSRGG